jgi:hypothetical protein
MGTKNNPGKFDCYVAADPDEPMFVLLGRDPCAPMLVQIWAKLREKMGEDPEKVQEAIECSLAMGAWANTHAKSEKIQKFVEASQALKSLAMSGGRKQ